MSQPGSGLKPAKYYVPGDPTPRDGLPSSAYAEGISATPGVEVFQGDKKRFGREVLIGDFRAGRLRYKLYGPDEREVVQGP